MPEHATGSRAATGKHPGDERLGKIVEHIFGHINTSTADGRWLAREGRRLAQHAYDVGYDDGWAEGASMPDPHATPDRAASGGPPSFTLTGEIMAIINQGGPYVEAAIENACAHALREARRGGYLEGLDDERI